VRSLDQTKIGRVLTGDDEALQGGAPVTALLIQNTNPANIAPEQRLVKRGFLRDDLFACVHEQFMTDTARLADVVLPATMFLEHDDIYRGGGNQYIVLGPKLIDPPEGPRENLYVIDELAKRLGVGHMPGFGLTARQHLDWMLEKRGFGDFDTFRRRRHAEVQPDFETAHFIKGFAFPDGRFRFRPDWTGTPMGTRPPESMGLLGPWQRIPEFPDHADFIEAEDAEHPFRLATSPARSFLNSSFTETPGSKKREGRPEVQLHPDDAAGLGIADGDRVELGNRRGEIVLHAKLFDGVRRGVVIAEGIWPNSSHERGEGINVLTGADSIAPYGGGAVHDTHVWVRKAPGA
jgi:Anaerobic dehydrogenases, typically selenocysteine-containing